MSDFTPDEIKLIAALVGHFLTSTDVRELKKSELDEIDTLLDKLEKMLAYT